jgi:hypothetical protein
MDIIDLIIIVLLSFIAYSIGRRCEWGDRIKTLEENSVNMDKRVILIEDKIFNEEE